MFLTRVCGVTALAIAVYLWSRRKYRKLPPKTRGMIETSLQMQSTASPWYILEQTRTLGPIFTLNLPSWDPIIVATDPEIMRLMLEGDAAKGIRGADKPHSYHLFDPATAELFQGPRAWYISRKRMAPSFSTLNLLKQMPVLHKKMEDLHQILDDYAGRSESFDVALLMNRLSLDFILASMFGMDCGTLRHSAGRREGDDVADGGPLSDRILELFDVILRELNKRLFGLYRQHQFWNAEVRRAREASDEMLGIAQDTSIIGHLRRIPYVVEEERAADVVALLLAGFDTTSYTIAWSLVELARNPACLAKLQAELDRANPSRCRWSNDMLSGLEYLGYVIKEAMRLWPVSALGSIRCAETDISVGEYVIPKGCEVFMPFFAAFRTGISDPDVFQPERWAASHPDAVGGLRDMCYTPFSSGKRNCVGQNLALLELRLVLATLVQRYDFGLEDPAAVQTEFFLTLKPHRAHMRVSVRPPPPAAAGASPAAC